MNSIYQKNRAIPSYDNLLEFRGNLLFKFQFKVIFYF